MANGSRCFGLVRTQKHKSWPTQQSNRVATRTITYVVMLLEQENRVQAPAIHTTEHVNNIPVIIPLKKAVEALYKWVISQAWMHVQMLTSHILVSVAWMESKHRPTHSRILYYFQLCDFLSLPIVSLGYDILLKTSRILCYTLCYGFLTLQIILFFLARPFVWCCQDVLTWCAVLN